jgi:hypothetical protein
VPKTGKYQFLARKFWQHGPFRWRFDGQAWQSVGNNATLLDDAPLRQFVGANWISAGRVELKEGRHTLRIEITENKGAAAFDAFVLTLTPFTARGKLKPGEKYNRAPADWFAFEPDADTFEKSPLDMRFLNEKFAGENGAIQVKGEQFVHSKTGEPVRFWAINTGGETVNMDQAGIDYFARSLAKQGVNLVRLHGGVWGKDFRVVDREHLQKIHYFVSAMKREGIYTCLSIYFPLWLQLDEKSGFAGYKGKHPFSLLFFSSEFQEIYRSWWQTLLTTPNPYTKLPLKDDPAVAMLEMVNEDSNLFWTFSAENIPAPQMSQLEKQFGAWLTKKYGSLRAAFTRWGGSGVQGDVQEEGRVGFRPLYELFNNRDLRSQDTATFLTLNQKGFYESTYRYLKQDLGFQGSVYASNWITADARYLGVLDKWSNTVADFMDRHGYFGGVHEGERASYSINPGERYDDRSALLFSPLKAGEKPDYSLPIMDTRYNGKPSVITEINWTPPNRFRADMPLLCAAYGSLQGTDAFFFFATSSQTWEERIGKFGIRTPVTMGQFPATAFLYRKGLLKEGASMVDANLRISDIQKLQGSPVITPLNLDELRAKDIPLQRANVSDKSKSIDPLTYLVGKVNIQFSQEGGAMRVADLTAYLNREAKQVKSQTGETLWDYGKGLVTVNAPQAQGITGFLERAGEVKLGGISIRSRMEYGTLLLIAMDGKPLKESQKMLLQVMSEEKNYGWEAPGEGVRPIVSTGTPPLVVRKFSGTLTFHRTDAEQLKIIPLDANGYPLAQLQTSGTLALQPTTLYYLIEK